LLAAFSFLVARAPSNLCRRGTILNEFILRKDAKIIDDRRAFQKTTISIGILLAYQLVETLH
jgi:hypothetical protein